MKKMKKILSLFCAMVLCVSVTACGEKQQRRKKQRQKSFHSMNPPFSEYSTTKKVKTQWLKSAAFT